MGIPGTAYVTWCCGHREPLAVTLPAALREPWHVVLVDYSDPNGSGDWAERLRDPNLTVVRAAARIDAARRPIPSQARAWLAALAALPPSVRVVVLSDPLTLVPPGLAARLAARPAAEAWWVDSLLVLPVDVAREYAPCPAYVGGGVEVADVRARLVAAGIVLRAVPSGVGTVARPPPVHLASVRLLGQRVSALGLGQGLPRAALGRLAGAA